MKISKGANLGTIVLSFILMSAVLFGGESLGENTQLLAYIVFGLYGIIVGLVLHYRLWDSIQDEHTALSPGKAVGFLFIPIFNFYWMYRSFYGFAVECNLYIDRHNIEARKLPENQFKLQYALYLIASLGLKIAPGTLGIFPLILGLIVVVFYFILVDLCINAVNAVLAQKAEGGQNDLGKC